MTVTESRQRFEADARAAVRDLDVAQRGALVAMLNALRAAALRQAAESQRKNKWMMVAYWRVVAVYAGHFARLTRTTA